MAEDQTPMKQEILESLLTPSEDVIVRDHEDREVRHLESLSAKLKEIISDKSSPYDDFPNFEPSEPKFSADFFELVSKIEEDGAELAIQRGMNQEILEQWIANAKEIRKIRDEEDKNRLRLNLTKVPSESPSSYDKFKVPPTPAAPQVSGSSSLATRPRRNWGDPDSDTDAEAEAQIARDWGKVSLLSHSKDKQKLIDDATSRATVLTKEQVDAAVNLIEGYGARKDPQSIELLRANFARVVKSGLRISENALGLCSMSQARINGEISSQGDVGPDPDQCVGQIAKGEAKSSLSREEGLVSKNMRAEIFTEEELLAKRKLVEHDLVNGKLNFGLGCVINKAGVRCITISSDIAVYAAERLAFQRTYLAALKEGIKLEIKKPNGLIPDADLALLLLEAENLQITPSTNLELLYEPTSFSAFMSSFPGMNDGINLEAKIRNVTRDATNIGYFARLGSFQESCVLQKNEGWKDYLVRMIKDQKKLKSLSLPPNANLSALGYVVCDDGVPLLLKGGFVCYKALQEIRYRRSAEPMVMQFVTDELLIRAGNGMVTIEEVEDVLAKLKAAGFDGRPPKVNRGTANGIGSPLDQVHGHFSNQQLAKKQQQQKQQQVPPPGRGRAQQTNSETQKVRSNSPERKLGIYKKFVVSMEGKLANYPKIADAIQEIVKKELNDETIFVEDDQGHVIIPLKFSQGNRSDRLRPSLHGKLPERAFVGFQVLRDIYFGGALAHNSSQRVLTPQGEMYKAEHDTSWRTNLIAEAPEKKRAKKKNAAGDDSRANACVTVLEDDKEVPALTGALTRFGK